MSNLTKQEQDFLKIKRNFKRIFENPETAKKVLVPYMKKYWNKELESTPPKTQKQKTEDIYDLFIENTS